MSTKYTRGNKCKTFQDGTAKLLVYDNHDNIQVCRRTPTGTWAYVIIPKELCKAIGTELFELGRPNPYPTER